jgi:hypothetical protein
MFECIFWSRLFELVVDDLLDNLAPRPKAEPFLFSHSVKSLEQKIIELDIAFNILRFWADNRDQTDDDHKGDKECVTDARGKCIENEQED